MKKGDWRMSVETLCAGQVREYGPTRYHHKVFFEQIPYNTKSMEYEPSKWSKEIVTRYLRAVKHWYDNPEWHQPTLKKLENIGPGLWEFIVEEAWTD